MAVSAAAYIPKGSVPNIGVFGTVGRMGYETERLIAKGSEPIDSIDHPSLILLPKNMREEVLLFEIEQLLQGRDFYAAVNKILDIATMNLSEEAYQKLSELSSEAIQGMIAEGASSEASHFYDALTLAGLDLNNISEKELGNLFDMAPEDPDLEEDQRAEPDPAQKAEIDQRKWVRNIVTQMDPEELAWRQRAGTLNLNL